MAFSMESHGRGSILLILRIIGMTYGEVAGSLKLGTVSAIDIMRTLYRGDQPSVLGRAIKELGRIAKTLYLLNYVDDEAYRPRILTQLNRGEGRHGLARVIFHGQKGELRQGYREGQ